MSTYFVGDVHGCLNNLKTMLDRIHFDPNVDTLHFTGDVVARGPHSLEVLRFIYSLNTRADLVLGNHEFHLLKKHFEINNKKCDTSNYFDTILNAPDCDQLIHWLCNRPIMYIDEHKKILMTHAGISPNWNINNAKKYAQEIEQILISDYSSYLFTDIHLNKLNTKNNITIKKLKKIQENINVFTKIRYVHLNGELDLKYKGAPKCAPKNLYPWFSIKKHLISSTYNIIFGHWASLKDIKIPAGIYGLDSGCCWGGALTALRWEDKKIIQISCTPPS